MNIYASSSWFGKAMIVIGMMLPVLVAAAVVVFLIVQGIRLLVRDVRSGDARRRREKRRDCLLYTSVFS